MTYHIVDETKSYCSLIVFPSAKTGENLKQRYVNMYCQYMNHVSKEACRTLDDLFPNHQDVLQTAGKVLETHITKQRQDGTEQKSSIHYNIDTSFDQHKKFQFAGTQTIQLDIALIKQSNLKFLTTTE